MGRLLSDRSPVKVTLMGKPAAAPISSRALVPLLPQSIGRLDYANCRFR
jgi:hypothetical protein